MENKLSKKLRIFIGVVLTVIMLFAVTMEQSWATTGYTTEKYVVNAQVQKNNSTKVTETITVNFTEAKHGIYRNIPYKSGQSSISDIKVEGENFEIESQSDYGVSQKVIKIGDANKIVKGNKTYTISYVIEGYDDNNTKGDVLYLDLLPVGWETPIKSTKISLTLPDGIDLSKINVYASKYGSNVLNENVNYKYDSDTNNVVITGENLGQGVGVTVQTDLPEGYWVDPKNNNWVKWPLIGILIGVPLIIFLLWLKFGRDPKIIKTVEFYPPEGMTSAEIGYVVDGVIDNKDMISLIMFFASKNYISINEYEKNKFEITKLKSMAGTEKTYVKTFFNALFTTSTTVKLDDLDESFGDSFMASKDQLTGFYSRKNKLFTTSSKVCRGIGLVFMMVPAIAAVLLGAYFSLEYLYGLVAIPVALILIIGFAMVLTSFDKKDSMKKKTKLTLMIIGTVLIICGIAVSAVFTKLLFGSWQLFIGVLVSMAITFVFTMLMKARTKESTETLGKILGFKDFIKNAEVDKLKLLVEEDPEYFYSVTPYAYVMGLSDKWAKKFENIPTKAPDWYNGYSGNTMFNVMWYAHMMNSCSRSFASNVTVSSIDTGDIGSGGGFGGGFSGGGFGGGGGGAW